MEASRQDIKNLFQGMDKEFLIETIIDVMCDLEENGVFVNAECFTTKIKLDFSKHDERICSELKKEKENFSNILSRMTPEARKAIESGELLGTKFMTCAELDKIKCENKELKSQCEHLKADMKKSDLEIQRLREKCGEVPEEDTTPKRKFNIGDVVLCHKFSIERNMVFSAAGLNLSQPSIDTSYFNRKAYISDTYKRLMEQHGEENPEDKDEYKITFLDNGESLAWVSGDELALLMKY